MLASRRHASAEPKPGKRRSSKRGAKPEKGTAGHSRSMDMKTNSEDLPNRHKIDVSSRGFSAQLGARRVPSGSMMASIARSARWLPVSSAIGVLAVVSSLYPGNLLLPQTFRSASRESAPSGHDPRAGGPRSGGGHISPAGNRLCSEFPVIRCLGTPRL